VHNHLNLSAKRQGFTNDILARLHEPLLDVRAVVEALGVSTAYASQIRRGVVVPHPMYYGALEALVPRSS
jgi:hypothetical protein